ncbi:MAG: hypothetical protein JNL36_03945 [Candidatus Kapabacteria bacterium]|nr:hypothetical protein [Candidatus Kapabacteria bacterium]
MELLTTLPIWAYGVIALALIFVVISIVKKLFKIALAIGVVIILFLVIAKLASGFLQHQ